MYTQCIHNGCHTHCSGSIIAGDAEDDAIDQTTATAGPWLADDVDVRELDSVKGRFFVSLAGKLQRLLMLLTLVGVVGGSLFLCACCACSKAWRGRERGMARDKVE